MMNARQLEQKVLNAVWLWHYASHDYNFDVASKQHKIKVTYDAFVAALRELRECVEENPDDEH
jgi:hypothetical protein